jgi:NAD-dependent SIR2 family protein deacetylase
MRCWDLHGRLASVRCIQCSTDFPRARFQTELGQLNPAWPVDGDCTQVLAEAVNMADNEGQEP